MFQRVVENGITCFVGEVGEDDRVFLVERVGVSGADEPECDEYSCGNDDSGCDCEAIDAARLGVLRMVCRGNGTS